MAKVTAKVTGGSIQEMDVSKVGDARSRLSLGADYKATVNGEPEGDSYELDDYDFLAFAPGVKGGRVHRIRVRKGLK